MVVLARSLACEHDVEAPTQDLHDAVPSVWRELGVLDRCENDVLRNRGLARDERVPGQSGNGFVFVECRSVAVHANGYGLPLRPGELRMSFLTNSLCCIDLQYSRQACGRPTIWARHGSAWSTKYFAKISYGSTKKWVFLPPEVGISSQETSGAGEHALQSTIHVLRMPRSPTSLSHPFSALCARIER